MQKILVLAHTEQDGSAGKALLEAITATKALGAAFVIGLFGEKTDEAAAQVVNTGAEKVLAVTDAALAQPRYATDAAAAEALIKASGADVVISTGTSRMSRVIAGVTHRVGGRIDKHVTAVASEGGEPVVTRWYYRQRMMAKITRTQRPWVIVLDPGTNEPWTGDAGSAAAEAVPFEAPATRTKVEGVQSPDTGEQTIRPEAETLFVAGAGWTKKQSDGKPHVKEAGEIILDFVRSAQASLGSSKSLVDQAGEGHEVLTCMSHLNQVGQTGSTPRHAKGLATCCHGEEPHVVGWRFINERRAVNLDANCGWAQGKADVLYVADAFAVMRKVNELLKG